MHPPNTCIARIANKASVFEFISAQTESPNTDLNPAAGPSTGPPPLAGHVMLVRTAKMGVAREENSADAVLWALLRSLL